MGHITAYLDQFGYIILFAALLLELIALPLPGELIMSYAGYLVYQGHLNWALSILLAGFGACIGMTISYWTGRKLGAPFFDKYGRRLHMGTEQIEKISIWYEKYGNKLLIVAYFIPGVRHITGYFSGITRLPYRLFALFAYSGAFIWVTAFITVGKILGPGWEQFHTSITKYLLFGSMAAACTAAVIYIYRKHRVKLKSTFIKMGNQILAFLHLYTGVEVLAVCLATISSGIIILLLV